MKHFLVKGGLPEKYSSAEYVRVVANDAAHAVRVLQKTMGVVVTEGALEELGELFYHVDITEVNHGKEI